MLKKTFFFCSVHYCCTFIHPLYGALIGQLLQARAVNHGYAAGMAEGCGHVVVTSQLYVHSGGSFEGF